MEENNLKFRYATREDVDLVLYFIKAIAKYEKMEDEVIATKESLEYWLFDRKQAEVIFALVDNKEIGFALFFHNFSTFQGRAGLYLEDIFILEQYRGKGYGKAIFKELANIALKRGCGRMEWCCLDWNIPSINFYKAMGAIPLDTWTTYRLDRKTIEKLVNKE